MGVVSAPLNYDEQLFLAAYWELLGNKYHFDDANRTEDHISRDHIQAQKVGFFLNMCCLLPGYCFSWNRRGPFSSKFQELLADLDAKETYVRQFYNDYTQRLLEDMLPGCLSSHFRSLRDSVYSFIMKEQEIDGATQQTDNLELLGSLLYIATTVLPGQDFDCVSEELVSRKASFSDTGKNKRAWKCLQKLDFAFIPI